MNKYPGIAAVLCILMLSGCATNGPNLLPILGSKQSPALSSGYVAAMFSRTWYADKLGFSLGIVNTATAEKFALPFGAETGLPNDLVDEFAMIQLPPGKYRIENWRSYSLKDKEQTTQTSIAPDSVAGLPFTIAPGEVVFIGSYAARRGRNSKADGNNPWSVHHQRITLQYVQKGLSNSYPLFISQPLSCPSCIE